MTKILSDVPPAPVVAVRPRPLERLEAEIVELSSQLTAATSRLLGLVGEFAAVEGWREWGMRSTAHWLSWQCGVGMTTGREQVRVARALRTLPLVSAEFAAGRMSYSKVRAVSRVATVETEATLVEWALHATAAQLDRLVSAQRRVVRTAEVRARHDARYLSWRWDDDGSLIGSFRLPPEQAAVLLQALEVAKESLPTVAPLIPDAPAEAPAVDPANDTPAEAPLALAPIASEPVGWQFDRALIEAFADRYAAPDTPAEASRARLDGTTGEAHPADPLAGPLRRLDHRRDPTRRLAVLRPRRTQTRHQPNTKRSRPATTNRPDHRTRRRHRPLDRRLARRPLRHERSQPELSGESGALRPVGLPRAVRCRCRTDR
jgi:hypothetical protein